MAAAYKIIPGIVKVINVNGQMKAYEFSLQDLEQSRKLQHRLPKKSLLQDYNQSN